jgi:hypothetical protein
MRSDFGVPWDSDRMKFFFLIYEKGGAFYVQVFPKDRYSRCVRIQIIADGMHDPQILRMRSSDG